MTRMYDLWVLGDAPGKTGPSSFLAPPGNRGLCTGVLKLAQRWLLAFMTPRNSRTALEGEFGSDFLSWLRNSNVRSEVDLHSYFSLAARQVASQLRNEETDDMPDDERLDSAVLERAVITPTSVELHIRIRSRAGDSRQILLPVPGSLLSH